MRVVFDAGDLDLDHLADFDHFVGVGDAAVGQLRNRHQSVDAAEVDEAAEGLNARHHTVEDLSDREGFPQLAGFFVALFFKQGTS